MATGEKHVNIYNKRMMSQDAWDQYFFLYLDDKVDDALQAVFIQSGILDDDPILLGSTANDTFTLDITNASRCVDGFGRIMDLSQVDVSFYEDYPFENDNTETYYVGIKYASVPDDIERNPRSREPEYPWQLDTIGEVGVADSFNDTSTEIELTVDGVTQVGVNHAGRPVMVWLTNPVSPVASVAYYNGVIIDDGGVNKIVIPYSPTLGPLGQTAPEFPISTTAADYNVWVKGVSWFEGVDIRADPDYAFIGTVTGNGPAATPTVFDITDQRPIFLFSLDKAYRANTTDTPAPGRTIFADKYAMRIVQSATTLAEQDPFNAALHIDKINETIAGFSLGKRSEYDVAPFSAPAFDGCHIYNGVELLATEDVSLAAASDVITFTRGGVDLTLPAIMQTIFEPASYLVISGSASDDGVYFIDIGSITATTIQAQNTGFAPASFTGGTGTAQIFFPSYSRVFGNPLTSSWIGLTTEAITIFRSQSGSQSRMIGFPTNTNRQFFRKYSITNDTERYEWNILYTGRDIMEAGGATYVNVPTTNDIVSGWANYQVNKRNNQSAPFESEEDSMEWGWDYRGTDFAKGGATPGFQLADTHRIPFKSWDAGGGGTEFINVEEAFTTTATPGEIQLTRGGDLDVSKVPAFSSFGKGLIIVEVQFDTPTSPGDGVYFVSTYTAPDKLFLRDIQGTGAFTVGTGQTGVVRFYGGMFSGPYNWNSASNMTAHMVNIVSPGLDTGCIRMWSEGDQTIGGGNDKYHAMLLTGFDNASFGWGVRDGGQMFARAFSTRSYLGGSTELTQWDQVDTALVNTDLVVSDEIDLDESVPRSLLLPTTLANGDVVKRNGGGSWTVTRQVNLMKGTNDNKLATGTTTRKWYANRSTGALVGGVDAAGMTGQAEHIASIHLPQNAVVTAVRVRTLPHEGSGGADAVGVRVYRSDFSSATPGYLNSGEVVRASGGDSVAQTVTYTPDQNATVDNSLYSYNVALETSDDNSGAFTDLFYGCEIDFIVTKLGENWFDAF